MKRILVIDVGGTNTKFHITDGNIHSFPSDLGMTASQMCYRMLKLIDKDNFDVVTIGYPGPVCNNKPLAEPEFLEPGWVEYDYNAAFGKPVKIINDAAMQAIGSYRRDIGKRMFFLGLGTGLGTCLISNHLVVSLEVANLPYKNGKSYGDFLARRGLDKYGEEKWSQAIDEVVKLFKAAFIVDDFVLGGGNAARLLKLPSNTRRVDNSFAIKGGAILWADDCAFSFG